MEVGEPIELLRAKIVLHARSLINTKVIRNNLGRVWPYLVERHFDPRDETFMPQAFSVCRIKLIYLNWKVIGQRGCDELPIFDPRGRLTLVIDG